MQEIASRGPITCAINAMPLLAHDGFGIIQDEPELARRKEFGPNRQKFNDKNGTDHLIELVGWGVDQESGTPYWELR